MSNPNKSSLLDSLSNTIGDWLLHDLARRGTCARDRGTGYFRALLDEFGVRYSCEEQEIHRIPKAGPVVLVVNHPFGLAEGPILGDLLASLRPDTKFLANSLLTAIPDLGQYLIPVDPFGGVRATKTNWKGIRDSLQWLRDGHLLVTFPAGEVASFQWPHLDIVDPHWHAGIARLIRLSGATVVPVYFHGTNSPAFHAAGLLHPSFRTFLLPHEFHNKRGSTIRVSVGAPIPAKRLSHLADDGALMSYLRNRTYLQERTNHRRAEPPVRAGVPVTAPVSKHTQSAEIEGLAPSQLLVSSAEFDVYLACAEQIPTLLQEIGRLREVAFRAAGEGSGNAVDLDIFDQHYQHLFMWDREKQQLVGAYRVAQTDRVTSRFGAEGLYTSTLFRLKPGFLEAIQPALELGRSFVSEEYQRSYTPLLLLWKAIGAFVVANPEYKTLFGPVRISRDYSALSRELMVAYARARCRNQHVAKNVGARRKLGKQSPRTLDIEALGQLLPDLNELSSVVSEIEPDGKGVPVLLHQYMNLGGEVLEFSIDGSFSDVLDGLVVVDLTQTNRRILERYMGREGAASFLEHHSFDATTCAHESVPRRSA